MFAAYTRIFTRMGLDFRAVAADTGAIGGSRSHEFQVIAETGEDTLAYCPDSGFAANVELAEAVALVSERAASLEGLTRMATPGMSKCEDVAAFLGLPLERTVKSVVLATDLEGQPSRIWLLLLRGDHTLNEVKASKLPGLETGFRLATEEEILRHFGCKPGYLGPIGPVEPITVIADSTVNHLSDFVCGANEEGHHYTGVNWGRDLPEPEHVGDLRNVVPGDPSPDGMGRLAILRGIEVGHVFFLGTQYSRELGATYLNESGKPQFMVMGCYGIGVTRLLGAAIEQNHDARGIIWPRPLAPFEVVICPVGWSKNEKVRDAALRLYDELLEAGIDVILDDRDERPGVMFADWELIGVPLRITIGDRGLTEGLLEMQDRREGTPIGVPIAGVIRWVKEWVSAPGTL